MATDVVLGTRHHERVLDTAPLPHHPSTTTSWRAPLTRVELDAVLDARPAGTVRAKGVFDLVEHPDRRTVVQVVGRRSTVTPGAPWRHGEERRSVLVTIGAPTPDA